MGGSLGGGMESPCGGEWSSMVSPSGEGRRAGGAAAMPARRPSRSDDSERGLGVADQQVLALLGVVEHHQVVLPADPRGRVPAEGGADRVGLIVVHPCAAGLDGATGSVGDVLLSRSEEHTSELQSRGHLVCRLLLEKKKLRIYRLFVL